MDNYHQINEKDLLRLLTNEEYRILYELWMRNAKEPNATAICIECSNRWNDILIIHEPDTEFLSLSYKERMKSIETNHPEDRDKYIGFR